MDMGGAAASARGLSLSNGMLTSVREWQWRRRRISRLAHDVAVELCLITCIARILLILQ